jgi:hypothetical protein
VKAMGRFKGGKAEKAELEQRKVVLTRPSAETCGTQKSLDCVPDFGYGPSACMLGPASVPFCCGYVALFACDCVF